MNPSTQPTMQPPAPVTPQPQLQPQPLPPAGKPTLPKKWLLIGGAVLLVIIVVVLLMILNNKPSSNTTGSKTPDPSLYISRQGFAFDAGHGDPYALQVSDGVQTYRGQQVVQACAVMSPSDIIALGKQFQADQLTGTIKRTYFDGKGLGNIILDSSTALPFDQDTNACLYRLNENNGRDYISLNVFQPSYVNMGSVDETQDRYAPVADSHGLKVFKQKPTGDAEVDGLGIYILRANNLAAQLTVAVDDTGVQAKVLDRIAGNLATAQTKPTPLPIFSLKSPVFTGGPILRACDLLDNDTYKAAFHTDASPLVRETASTTVGVVTDLVINGKATSANFGASDCERNNSARTYLDGYTLQVFTETYETVDGAKAQMAFEKNDNPYSQNIQESTTKVGDESFYADADAAKHALIFRKGRVIVKVGFGSPNHPATYTPAQAMQITIPAAQVMLKHLQNF